MAESGRLIGAAVPTVESQRFVRGEGSYVDDLYLPGTLHVAFARSPYGHARIRRVDASAARAQPGVVGVWTGADLAQRLQPTVVALPTPGLRPVRFWPLAVAKARFAGDPVAAIVADDRYHAEDGVDAVAVDYEPLPAVADPLRALAPDAPIVDDELGENLLFDHTISAGDVDAAFARADHVVRGVFSPQRLTQAPLEGRGCVAQWDGRRLTLWASTRLPHLWRLAIARALGLGEGDVRVIVPDVGGAFGQKISPAREEMAVCALAMLTRRPVKWIEDRRENLGACSHARGERLELEAAFAADGTLLGMRGDLLSDSGAYCIIAASALPMIAATMLPGPYRVDAMRVRVRAVHTNTCPLGAYRGPWAVEALARECLFDEAARALGSDPAALRERNLLRPDELPCRNAGGVTYEAVNPPQTFDAALRALGYEAARADQQRAAAAGRRLGIGLATFLEPTAFGTGYLNLIGIPRGGHETATVRVEPSGQVTVLVGTANHGQNHETTLAQIVGDTLGLPLERVRVVQGDTDAVPFGMGAGNSRVAVIAGGACLRAAGDVAAKLRRLAAHRLEVAPEDVELANGYAQVRGLPDRRVAVAELAYMTYFMPTELPPGEEGGLIASRYYEPPPVTLANATHACIAEIDTETGVVTLRRFVVAEDCGVMINPRVVDGQVIGAVAQGIGSALYEHCVYDERGQFLTGSFMDYVVPSASEVPEIEVHHVVTPSASLGGFKGAGEGGVLGALPAICNAVADAVGAYVPPPLTPERVLAALRSQRNG